MTYEPNTWVNFDGYVSLVIGVWQGYYEPFDAEVVDGKIRCGERRYRQIVLRDIFDNHGRRLAGVPAMKYLEAIAEDLNPASEEGMFGREEVWMATSEYLDRLADRYTTAPVAEALRTHEWQKKYNWIYDVCS